MLEEYIVKRFVKRRRVIKNISDSMIFVLLGFALVTQRFFRGATMSNSYAVAIALIFFISAGMDLFIDSFMSTCPICHMHISTANKSGRRHHPPRRGGGIRLVFRIDVGPLPDRCPHCGTPFNE